MPVTTNKEIAQELRALALSAPELQCGDDKFTYKVERLTLRCRNTRQSILKIAVKFEKPTIYQGTFKRILPHRNREGLKAVIKRHGKEFEQLLK